MGVIGQQTKSWMLLEIKKTNPNMSRVLECCAHLTSDNATPLSPYHRHKATPEHLKIFQK
jgi:hypothetical protein